MLQEHNITKVKNMSWSSINFATIFQAEFHPDPTPHLSAPSEISHV